MYINVGMARMGSSLLPDEGARGLDALDDRVLVVGEGGRGVALHCVHGQPHRLLGGDWLRRRLAGQHAGRQAEGGGVTRGTQKNRGMNEENMRVECSSLCFPPRKN